jgi:hypothetical protein
MAEADKTVFLSYRRDVSWALAHLVRDDLVGHGFDVFVDVEDLGLGEFEPAILHQIETRAHFLLLLEPRSLTRIDVSGDWLRREIAHALATGRNVVPVLANNARMPHPNDLPADIMRIALFNAVPIQASDVAHGISRLRMQLLRMPRGRFADRGAASGRLDVAESLRLLDHVVDGGSVDIGDLFDPVAGPELVERIGPLAEATLAVYVRPWCEARLSRTAGTRHNRIPAPVLRWLFPSPPAPFTREALARVNPLPATLVDAAEQVTRMLADPSAFGSRGDPADPRPPGRF